MGEISIQEAMQAFLKKSKLKYGIQAVQIEEVWEELMGATIKKRTALSEGYDYSKSQ